MHTNYRLVQKPMIFPIKMSKIPRIWILILRNKNICKHYSKFQTTCVRIQWRGIKHQELHQKAIRWVHTNIIYRTMRQRCKQNLKTIKKRCEETENKTTWVHFDLWSFNMALWKISDSLSNTYFPEYKCEKMAKLFAKCPKVVISRYSTCR